jgi:hypothetical protein
MRILTTPFHERSEGRPAQGTGHRQRANMPWPVLAAIAFLAPACMKEDGQEAVDNALQAVVEAYLSPGGPIAVRITRETPFQEQGLDNGIPGLLVTIEHEGAIDTLTDAGGGDYQGGPASTATTDAYTLRFAYNGHEVSGTTTLPPAPQGFVLSANTLEIPVIDMGSGPPSGGAPSFPDPIDVDWQNPDAAYHLVLVECIESDPEQIADSDAPVRPRFRTEPTTDVQAQLSFRDFTYYGTHRVILYRLNADYAALYMDNGANSHNLTTPRTNIVNGLGIFTGVNTDTLFLDVQEQ